VAGLQAVGEEAAQRVAGVINGAYPGSALAENGSVVALRAPGQMGMAGFISQIENLPITVDSPAKVIIDEVNGVIVMGDAVRISRVAIAQGNLTIRVTETPQVSQPGPFAPPGAQTTVVPRTDIQVDDQSNRRLAVLPSGVSLQELVEGLNALGVGPRDMIAILQAIKAAGALQAEIEVM
jgi:flagellar P-ring protein precursor FlgI